MTLVQITFRFSICRIPISLSPFEFKFLQIARLLTAELRLLRFVLDINNRPIRAQTSLHLLLFLGELYRTLAGYSDDLTTSVVFAI